MLPPPAARWVLRGIAKQAALKDQRYRAPSTLLAPNPRARAGAPAATLGHGVSPNRRTERSALSCPVDQAESSLRRLGGASAISFLGRERSIMLPPPAARWVLRGIAKQAALKDQRYRAPSTLLAPNPRARGARRASDVGPGSDRQSAGQQSDPRSRRPATPAGRRFGNFVFGARTIDHAAAAGRALGPTGYRQTGGTERSALSCPVDLTRAESSCATRWAALRQFLLARTIDLLPRRPRAGSYGVSPTAALKDQRYRAPSTFAPNPSRRRLGGASAISFLGRERSIMLPPPAARWVLAITGNKATANQSPLLRSCL